MTSAATSPTTGGSRRSVTAPIRLPSSPYDRGDPPDEPDETLFEHPQVNVYSFPIGGKVGSPHAVSKTPLLSGVLPWQSTMQTIISLERPLRLRRPKTGAPFLEGGTKAKEMRLVMMPNTLMWCVDGKSAFATNLGVNTYRIQFPFNNESDQQKVEAFKEALRKVIQYEPTDVPCPFQRESKTNTPTQEEVESPQRRPKRTLIGDFEDLKPSQSGGGSGKRQSGGFGGFTHQRGSSLISPDDATGVDLFGKDVSTRNNPPETCETGAENTETKAGASDSIPPFTYHPQIRSEIEGSTSHPTMDAEDDPGMAQQDLPFPATKDPHSESRSHTESSPSETSSPSSLDERDPGLLSIGKQRSPKDPEEHMRSPTINTAATAGAVDSMSANDIEIHDLTEPSLFNTAQTPLATSNTTPSTAITSTSSPNSEPSSAGAPEIVTFHNDQADKDKTDDSFDSRAFSEPLSNPTIPESPPLNLATPSEPSLPAHLSEQAKSTSPATNPPASSTDHNVDVPTNPNRGSSTADSNTYILTKLIDLLTSPPSKFFSVFADLLRLICDRFLTGATSPSGSGGAAGKFRLPKTPGRWVDSEETSEADAEGGTNADGADSDPDSEDEWNSDGLTDDYGVPLGNEPVRADRRKLATESRFDAVTTGAEV